MKYKTVADMISDKRWTKNGPSAFDSASNYSGGEYGAYFVVVGRNRDSDVLTESNFACALDQLGGENEENGVMVGRFGHWACGWYELVMVHEDAPKEILEKAREILNSLHDYPVLDEGDWSEREYDSAIQTLESNEVFFQREVMKFLGVSDYSLTDEELTALDAFISEVFHHDGGYQGYEDAWVSDRAIERFVTDDYAGRDAGMQANKFYRLCKRAALKSA